jgi:Sec-independent protein translocase protein TatA
MSLGFGQILVILFVACLFFGNLPKRIEELANGISEFRKRIDDNKTSQK